MLNLNLILRGGEASNHFTVKVKDDRDWEAAISSLGVVYSITNYA